jgi:hypothetical protein
MIFYTLRSPLVQKAHLKDCSVQQTVSVWPCTAVYKYSTNPSALHQGVGCETTKPVEITMLKPRRLIDAYLHGIENLDAN